MTAELALIGLLAFLAVAVQSSVGFGSGLIFVPAATLVVGPGQSSHLIARNLDQPLILFVRDGVFHVRSGLPDRAQRFAANGTPQGAQPLMLDTPVEIGGTRVTIVPFNT